MIVILGATGKTGSVAVHALLKHGSAVRAVGRSTERLKSFRDAGAEVCVADLEDPKTVKAALEGATAVYALIPPNFAAERFRDYQRAVNSSLVSAIQHAEVPRVVLLSSLGANHARGTGPVVALHELEDKLRTISGVAVLSLRAGFFMENFLMNVQMVRSTAVFGSAAPPHAPMNLIAAADIGRYAARRLAVLDFRGFEVANLVGPATVTMQEVARTLGAAIGKPDLPYVQFSYDDAEKGLVNAGLKPELAGLYVELYRGAAQGLLEPEPGTAVVRTQTPLSEFARVFAAAYAGQAAA
jgi:uncharacterized protein YbjT (DUF2867 family)